MIWIHCNSWKLLWIFQCIFERFGIFAREKIIVKLAELKNIYKAYFSCRFSSRLFLVLSKASTLNLITLYSKAAPHALNILDFANQDRTSRKGRNSCWSNQIDLWWQTIVYFLFSLEIMNFRADENKISDYKLEAGSTLHMVLQLRGGF